MMKQFIPPISERETEDLIKIANCPDENIWQREAIQQAQKELIKRNISQEQQNQAIDQWNKELEEYFKKEADKLERNKTESYSLLEMILIFIFGPIRFFNTYDVIFTLKRDNYFLIFKQRLFILLLSATTWLFFIYFTYQNYEKKRLEEIDKVDISEWKKKYGYE